MSIMAKFKTHSSTFNGDENRQKGASIYFSDNFMFAQTQGIWKTLIFFNETERAKTGAMHQLVSYKGLLWEPHHTLY